MKPTEMISSGFYETSEALARQIVNDGFSAFSVQPPDFTFGDNLGVAIEQGIKHSAENGGSTFGIIEASFPSQAIDSGSDNNQIRISKESIAKLKVSRFMSCNSQGLITEYVDVGFMHEQSRRNTRRLL